MNTIRLTARGTALAMAFVLTSAAAPAAAQGRGANPGQPPAQGQAQRGGQGRAEQAPANAKVLARVRVPTSHANIHNGPSTGNELIVLAPRGTELNMVARRGEWIQVQVPQELRKTGIVMRWYNNETSGWMHDSTVEFVTPETKP